jgi:uncharacterized protein
MAEPAEHSGALRARSQILMDKNLTDPTKTDAAAPHEPLTPPAPRRHRGFAAMAPELVKAISRKGGVAAHAAGTAHEFSADEAREAGRKGGRASQAKRREQREKPLET